MLPFASVAVQVTDVSPSGKLLWSVAGERDGKDVRARGAADAQAAQNRIRFRAHVWWRGGGVVSTTVIVTVRLALFPLESVVVTVTSVAPSG